MMVSAHRNPVVGAEQASRTERMLSAEVGASVLDRGQGLDDGQAQAQGQGLGSGLGQGLVEKQEPGRGQVSESTKSNDQGGGQLVDKSAIDLALARAARGESPDAIIEESVVNNMEDDQEEAIRQAREEERNNNREKQKGYLLGWG